MPRTNQQKSTQDIASASTPHPSKAHHSSSTRRTPAAQRLTSLVEVKLSEASLSPLPPAVKIPLSELKDTLPVQTPDLEGLICNTSARFHLRPSGRPGPVEPMLVLTAPASADPTQSHWAASASPSLKALVVLLESENDRLTLRRWQEALADPKIYNEVLCDLAPHIERSCQSIARQRKTSFTPELIARGFRAAFKLLKSYNPTKGGLVTFLRGNLANRMIDELRVETTGRRQRNFLSHVERTRHSIEQREHRIVRADDPEVAKALGLKPFELVFKLQQVVLRRGELQANGGDEAGLERLEDPRLGTSPDQLRELIAETPPAVQKVLELREDGYSFEEVAGIFDVAVSVIQRTLEIFKLGVSHGVVLHAQRPRDPLRLSFGVLAREICKTGKEVRNWNDVSSYIESLDFFSSLKSSSETWAVEFKRRWFASDGSLRYALLPEKTQRIVADSIRQQISNIDTLPPHPLFEELFGAGTTRLTPDEVARCCLYYGILPADRPRYHPVRFIEGNGFRPTRYFNPTVVSQPQLEANVVSLMQEVYPFPTAIHPALLETRELLSLLALESPAALRRWGEKRGVWSRSHTES